MKIRDYSKKDTNNKYLNIEDDGFSLRRYAKNNEDKYYEADDPKEIGSIYNNDGNLDNQKEFFQSEVINKTQSEDNKDLNYIKGTPEDIHAEVFRTQEVNTNPQREEKISNSLGNIISSGMGTQDAEAIKEKMGWSNKWDKDHTLYNIVDATVKAGNIGNIFGKIQDDVNVIKEIVDPKESNFDKANEKIEYLKDNINKKIPITNYKRSPYYNDISNAANNSSRMLRGDLADDYTSWDAGKKTLQGKLWNLKDTDEGWEDDNVDLFNLNLSTQENMYTSRPGHTIRSKYEDSKKNKNANYPIAYEDTPNVMSAELSENVLANINPRIKKGIENHVVQEPRDLSDILTNTFNDTIKEKKWGKTKSVTSGGEYNLELINKYNKEANDIWKEASEKANKILEEEKKDIEEQELGTTIESSNDEVYKNVNISLNNTYPNIKNNEATMTDSVNDGKISNNIKLDKRDIEPNIDSVKDKKNNNIKKIVANKEGSKSVSKNYINSADKYLPTLEKIGKDKEDAKDVEKNSDGFDINLFDNVSEKIANGEKFNEEGNILDYSLAKYSNITNSSDRNKKSNNDKNIENNDDKSINNKIPLFGIKDEDINKYYSSNISRKNLVGVENEYFGKQENTSKENTIEENNKEILTSQSLNKSIESYPIIAKKDSKDNSSYNKFIVDTSKKLWNNNFFDGNVYNQDNSNITPKDSYANPNTLEEPENKLQTNFYSLRNSFIKNKPKENIEDIKNANIDLKNEGTPLSSEYSYDTKQENEKHNYRGNLSDNKENEDYKIKEEQELNSSILYKDENPGHEISLPDGKEYGSFIFTEAQMRAINILKDKNTFSKQVGRIYVSPFYNNNNRFKNFEIPFEFKPQISEGSISAKYQAEQLLGRINAMQVYTGTEPSTLSLTTEYLVLSPNDVVGEENKEIPKNQYSTNAWEYYWTNRKLQEIEWKYRSLVYPNVVDENYMLKPPIIQIKLNQEGSKDDNIRALYTYPMPNDIDMKQYFRISSIDRYKKYVVTSVQIDDSDTAPMDIPSLYKYEKDDGTSTELEKINNFSLTGSNNTIDDFINMDTTITRRGFKVTLQCVEVSENFLDIVPDFRVYYNAWTNLKNNDYENSLEYSTTGTTSEEFLTGNIVDSSEAENFRNDIDSKLKKSNENTKSLLEKAYILGRHYCFPSLLKSEYANYAGIIALLYNKSYDDIFNISQLKEVQKLDSNTLISNIQNCSYDNIKINKPIYLNEEEIKKPKISTKIFLDKDKKNLIFNTMLNQIDFKETSDFNDKEEIDIIRACSLSLFPNDIKYSGENIIYNGLEYEITNSNNWEGSEKGWKTWKRRNGEDTEEKNSLIRYKVYDNKNIDLIIYDPNVNYIEYFNYRKEDINNKSIWIQSKKIECSEKLKVFPKNSKDFEKLCFDTYSLAFDNDIPYSSTGLLGELTNSQCIGYLDKSVDIYLKLSKIDEYIEDGNHCETNQKSYKIVKDIIENNELSFENGKNKVLYLKRDRNNLKNVTGSDEFHYIGNYNGFNMFKNSLEKVQKTLKEIIHSLNDKKIWIRNIKKEDIDSIFYNNEFNIKNLNFNSNKLHILNNETDYKKYISKNFNIEMNSILDKDSNYKNTVDEKNAVLLKIAIRNNLNLDIERYKKAIEKYYNIKNLNIGEEKINNDLDKVMKSVKATEIFNEFNHGKETAKGGLEIKYETIMQPYENYPVFSKCNDFEKKKNKKGVKLNAASKTNTISNEDNINFYNLIDKNNKTTLLLREEDKFVDYVNNGNIDNSDYDIENKYPLSKLTVSGADVLKNYDSSNSVIANQIESKTYEELGDEMDIASSVSEDIV